MYMMLTSPGMILLSFAGTLVTSIQIPLMNPTIGVQFCIMGLIQNHMFFQCHLMQVTNYSLAISAFRCIIHAPFHLHHLL
jgi:hypothetical protein